MLAQKQLPNPWKYRSAHRSWAHFDKNSHSEMFAISPTRVFRGEQLFGIVSHSNDVLTYCQSTPANLQAGAVHQWRCVGGCGRRGGCNPSSGASTLDTGKLNHTLSKNIHAPRHLSSSVVERRELWAGIGAALNTRYHPAWNASSVFSRLSCRLFLSYLEPVSLTKIVKFWS